ncbi:MAG: hypothetical protein ACFFDH_00040 [Promethearchaeota archaeon]
MPFPNEHAARLKDPALFDPKTFRRTEGGTIYGSKEVPSIISIIWGKLKTANKPSDNPIPQALRFPIKDWTVTEAKKWLKDNNIKFLAFEEAVKETRQFIRLLRSIDKEDELIRKFAIVSELEDSFNTIIPPDGLIHPVENVPVDYNHERKATGAYLVDLGVQDVEVEINGEKRNIKSRVVEVHIPKSAKIWTKETHEAYLRGELNREDIPSLYEAVKNGDIAWVSVEFEPVKNKIERVFDNAGTLLREVYNEWRLKFLSLLDTKPGQDLAFQVRMYKDNSKISKTNLLINKNMKKKATKSLETSKSSKTRKTKECLKKSMPKDSERQTSEEILGAMAVKVDMILQILKEKMAKKKEEEKENVMPKKDKGKQKQEDENGGIENEDMESNEEPDKGPVMMKKGKGRKVGEKNDKKIKTKSKMGKKEIMKKVRSLESELEEKNSILRQNKKKIKELQDNYQRLANSPEAKANINEIDSAVDEIDGEGANEIEDEADMRIGKAQSRDRWM